MKVRLYKTFSKRKNSTKQPGVSDSYTEVDVKLKEFTSVKNPAFALNTTDFTFEYAYIPSWNRYYFVADQISINSTTTEYTLEEDVMATNKTAIGNTVARIAFSSSGYDTYIADTRMAVKTTKTFDYSSIAHGYFDDAGSYILTAFGKGASVTNGLGTSYALNEANIAKIHDWMGDETVFQKLTNYMLGNPLDSIFGCIWVPFDLDLVPGSSTGDIIIGNQSSQNDGKLITGFRLNGTGIKMDSGILCGIKRKYNDFRDFEPYTTSQLSLPGVGLIDINLSDFKGSSNVKVQTAIEYGTGDVMYYIYDDNNELKQTVSCNVASVCPLGQTTSNTTAAVSAVAGVGGGFGGLVMSTLSENPVGMLASGGAMLAGAANAALALNQHGTSIKGGTGGRVQTKRKAVELWFYYMDTEDCTNANYIAQKGRPVALTHAINNHSGYVQCDDASVAIAGDVWERDEVNAFLNSGFYYE